MNRSKQWNAIQIIRVRILLSYERKIIDCQRLGSGSTIKISLQKTGIGTYFLFEILIFQLT